MTRKDNPDVPIASQDVRVLTDEETRKIAEKLREDLDLSEGPGVTWEDIERAARKVLEPKPKKS